MTISVVNENLIKVVSPYLTAIIAGNADSYTDIDIIADINCCANTDCSSTNKTGTLTLATNKWYLDLSTPVGLDTILRYFQIQNTLTTQVYNLPNLNTDLGYVNATCPSGVCTLATYASHFSALWKPNIDNWFASLGITTNVTLTYSNNTLIIDGIPANFDLVGATYGAATPYQLALASYGSATEINAFLGSDGLYLTPKFFNLDSIIDGIYKITLKYNKADNSYVEETNCSFVDITIKCKVANSLNLLLQESNDSNLEKLGSTIHLLHYALVNGSNCGCNCTELCQCYAALIDLLNNVPQTDNCDC